MLAHNEEEVGKEWVENTNSFKEPQVPNHCSHKSNLLASLRNWLNPHSVKQRSCFFPCFLAEEWRGEGKETIWGHYLLSSVCQRPWNFFSKQSHDFKQSKEDSVNLKYLKPKTWFSSYLLKSSKAKHENHPCFRLSPSHMSCLEPVL